MGATCSVINFNTFQAISDVGQNITVVQTQTRTTAFNISKIRMLGYTILPFSLDIVGKYEIKHKVWITHEHTTNISGMQFFHEFRSSLNFEKPLLRLKAFQGSSMYGKHQRDKEYHGCSKFSPITLNKPVTIEPLSTYVIKRQCPLENSYYTEGTTYKPLKTAQVKGLIYYHTMVGVNESSFPILTAKQNPRPVTLQKRLLGHTFTPILEKGKRNQLFLINKPLQVKDLLIENCQFSDVEEIFEL